MYEDPIEAARKRMMPTAGQSFFPAVQRLFDDRSELNGMLNQSPETSFLGTPPAPTPTPTPRPKSYFQVPPNSQFNYSSNFGAIPISRPAPQPTPISQNSWQDWHARYGFNF